MKQLLAVPLVQLFDAPPVLGSAAVTNQTIPHPLPSPNSSLARIIPFGVETCKQTCGFALFLLYANKNNFTKHAINLNKFNADANCN